MQEARQRVTIGRRHDDPDHAVVVERTQRRHPKLCRLAAAVAEPHAQDVLLALQVDPDRGIDGPVGDLAVADLHINRVQNHRGVDALQRPAGPGCIFSTTRSAIREMVSLETGRHRSQRNATVPDQPDRERREAAAG